MILVHITQGREALAQISLYMQSWAFPAQSLDVDKGLD